MSDELHGWGPALDEIARRKAEAHEMGVKPASSANAIGVDSTHVSASRVCSTPVPSSRSATWLAPCEPSCSR
jgi:hypothetical protein